MKGNNNYIPKIKERCLISGPNSDNSEGYVYGEFDVLWMDESFILYSNKGCWPNLHKIDHVAIKKL